MPKYIDIEKLTITGVPLYDEDLDYLVSHRDLRNALMMMPSEKVVSKAAYEELKAELVAMQSGVLTDREILAIRAVAYGANTNKKLVAGFFTVYNDDRSIKEMIPFDEAIETVYELLDKIMEEHS